MPCYSGNLRRDAQIHRPCLLIVLFKTPIIAGTCRSYSGGPLYIIFFKYSSLPYIGENHFYITPDRFIHVRTHKPCSCIAIWVHLAYKHITKPVQQYYKIVILVNARQKALNRVCNTIYYVKIKFLLKKQTNYLKKYRKFIKIGKQI